MDQKLIESLSNKYKDYENSDKFIIACFIVFEDDKPASVKSFIERTFSANNFAECTSGVFYSLAAHWLNISKSKLDLEDYKNHVYSAITSAKLRCIAKFLETHPTPDLGVNN